MAKDWYSPGQVRFTRREALWLIQNLGTLREGHWPPEASNYIDIIGKRTGRHKAYFETPVEYATEIAMRLEMAGVDGLILLAIEGWGESEESITKYLGMSERTIRKRKERALAYVASGPNFRWHDTKKRRGMTYKEFITVAENKA